VILPSKVITLKNGKKITLRTLKPFEAQAMLQYAQVVHEESYQNFNQRADFWQNMPLADEEKILASFQASNSKFMLGAYHDETMIGNLSFVGGEREFTERNAAIGMSVLKKYYKQGLGTAMMEHTIEQAKLYGFHRIELCVRTYNDAAIALYEKIGFKKIGTRSETAFIDGKYVDEFYYELILK
jgi:RimJ/RimL family protein N-acetyltransferase